MVNIKSLGTVSILVIVWLYSCNSSPDKTIRYSKDMINSEYVNKIINPKDSFIQQVESSKKVNLCSLYSIINEQSVDQVIDGAKSLIKQVSLEAANEACMLSLVDTLSTLYIHTSYKNYIVALDSLSNYSDGFLSAHITLVTIKLFYQNFAALSYHLYNNKHSKLSIFLIDGFSENLSVYQEEEREIEIKKVKEFANDQMDKHSFTSRERAYINSLLDAVDPAKFD